MRKILLLPVCLVLSGCGFQPMYGSHSVSAQNMEAGKGLSQVEIAVIPDREGQILRNELVDIMHAHGTPDAPKYMLNFTDLNVTIRELDLTKNSEATRAQIIAATTIFVTNKETGEGVLTRNVKSISSYNILPSKFATRVTEDNARTSALKELARQIEQQLSLYFNR